MTPALQKKYHSRNALIIFSYILFDTNDDEKKHRRCEIMSKKLLSGSIVSVSENCLKMFCVVGATAGHQVPLLQEGVDVEEVLVVGFRGFQEFLSRDLKRQTFYYRHLISFFL